MTTPRDLLITAMDAEPDTAIGQGELSLALAGAELVDLLAWGAVTLEGELIVPGPPITVDDPLLGKAASALTRHGPPEAVDDWLWRRGRDLARAYAEALTSEGTLTRARRRWAPLSTGAVVVADSADHRHARQRWADREPVLTALAAAVGVPGHGDDQPAAPEGPVGTVLAAVQDAVTELAAVRQRRAIEKDAFDNTWRAP
ncbi:MAG: GPP34 family phosphoprotein [Streptomycetaceae bacterium]|nr:GPP34 family phosphoprotein [Streptomycetaceae bacterium]